MALSKAERSPDLDRPNMGIDSDDDPPYKSERQSPPINIQDSRPVSDSSLRIVLLGKTGAGKSATANTILGRDMFRPELNVDSVTHKCSDAHATVSGRSVSVVDTPGLFDPQMKPEESMAEIVRSVYLSSPGPHVFLIVFPANMRFTEHEQQIPQKIEMMFGQEVLKYSNILFTRGDMLTGNSVKKFIERKSKIKNLVDCCGGRYHVFNNKDEDNREQVNDLLEKIDTMIEQNREGHYSNQMFEDAQKNRQLTKKLIKRNSVSSRLADQSEATYVFNNKNKRNREQMSDLLQKTDTMIKQNDGYYSNQMFGDAKRFRQKKREMKQQEEKQRSEDIGKLLKKISAEVEAQKWL